MPKKIFIPLLIIGVLCATGLGIYIASNQSAQPTPQPAPEINNDFTITEIDRTFTLPDELRDMTYQTASPTSILLFSEPYEKLDSCAGKQLGELRLSDNETDFSIAVGGEYNYAKLTLQPLGPCGGDDGQRLADALSGMILGQ
jgi:hypothetical protein